MKGDGHVGRRKLLTASDTVAHDRVSVSDKRFTFVGLTTLDGSPVICIMIHQGNTLISDLNLLEIQIMETLTFLPILVQGIISLDL